MTDIENAVANLGRRAAECELWAETPELSHRERADAIVQAERYRSQQVAILSAAYPHANVLGEGPNVSHRAWNGALVAIAGEAILAAVIVIGVWIWSNL